MSKKIRGKDCNLASESPGREKAKTEHSERFEMGCDSSVGSRQSMIQVDDTTRAGLSRAPRSGRVARHYTYACVMPNDRRDDDHDDSSLKAPFMFSARQGEARLCPVSLFLSLFFSLFFSLSLSLSSLSLSLVLSLSHMHDGWPGLSPPIPK